MSNFCHGVLSDFKAAWKAEDLWLPSKLRFFVFNHRPYALDRSHIFPEYASSMDSMFIERTDQLIGRFRHKAVYSDSATHEIWYKPTATPSCRFAHAPGLEWCPPSDPSSTAHFCCLCATIRHIFDGKPISTKAPHFDKDDLLWSLSLLSSSPEQSCVVFRCRYVVETIRPAPGIKRRLIRPIIVRALHYSGGAQLYQRSTD